jgi:uncharacterized protein YbaR (Trm112 family)
VRLELTEVLACPRCGTEHGLIALIDQMDGRRIVSGRLDCPNCEDRHPIRNAIVRLLGSAPDEPPVSEQETSDLAAVSTALLGPPEGPEVLLVGPAIPSVAHELAELRPEAWVISYSALPQAVHDRVHRIAPGSGDPLPLRSGRVHGVVLSGGSSVAVAEAARVLMPGGRLVILNPGPEVPERSATVPLRELASDARAWLGAKT